MSRQQTIDFFLRDPDGYTDSMTEYDIKATKCASKQEYIQKSCEDALDFTPEQQEYVRECCKQADEFFRSGILKRYPHIQGDVIASIPWKLALTKGQWYEEGYPHTRMDIIFVSPEVIRKGPGATRILIHEKVHVYERLFPRHLEYWMKSEGYEVYKRQNEYPLRRSNPDLDGWVYRDKKGRETIALFKNQNPTGIDDSIYLGGKDWKFEHPYETLAYQIDYLFAGESFSDD